MNPFSRLGFLSLLAATTLAACGQIAPSNSEVNAVDKNGIWKPSNDAANPNQVFSFAKLVKDTDYVKSLKKNVGDGGAYIYFGEKGKFRTEMNLTAATTGDVKNPNDKRTATAGFWLDAFVFNKRMGAAKGKGMVLDIGAVGRLDTLGLDASVRFLGQDVYRGTVKDAIYDNSWMRDFSFGGTYYPVPLLGLKVNGKVGGELGLRLAAGVRQDNALALQFTPRAAVNGGLTGGVELLKFASAEAQGTARLADVKVGTGAAVGIIPAANFSYGNIGVQGGKFSALDGKVEIVARAGMNGILPGGIDKVLWTLILKALGVKKSDWEWRHTIWDPKPLYVTDVPRWGTDFAMFYKKPANKGDCEHKREAIRGQFESHKVALRAYRDANADVERAAADAALFYLDDISNKLNTICN